MCKKGFHCCENPIDVFNYYNDVKGKYAEVNILGKNQKENEKLNYYIILKNDSTYMVCTKEILNFKK